MRVGPQPGNGARKPLLQVVTTDNGGVREYVEPSRNALVVPPDDRKALAEAIIAVLQDPSLGDALRTEGIKTAQQRNWDVTVDRFEKFVHALVVDVPCPYDLYRLPNDEQLAALYGGADAENVPAATTPTEPEKNDGPGITRGAVRLNGWRRVGRFRS